MVSAIWPALGAGGVRGGGTVVGFPRPRSTSWPCGPSSTSSCWGNLRGSPAAVTRRVRRARDVLRRRPDGATGELVLYGAPLASSSCPADLLRPGAAARSRCGWASLKAPRSSPPRSRWRSNSPIADRPCAALADAADRAVVGAIWLAPGGGEHAGRRPHGRRLVINIPWTLHAMKTCATRTSRAPFAVAITTEGESREGAET